jgi:hypothetical protein
MALYAHKFSGQVATGESYSFGFWANGSSTLEQVHAAAVQWLDDFWTGPGGTNGYGSLVTPGVTATLVRTALITESNGLQTQLSEDTVSHAGIATGSALPADVAITVSLRSALANRSGRGRFYLPQPAQSTSTADGRILSTVVDTIIGALEPAWSTYRAWAQPVIYSRTNRSTVNISSFNVGDLYDTQRRRENKLPETRFGGTL